MALVGDNGSGKTSFLNCVLGLKDTDAGCISICGTEVNYLSIDQLNSLTASCIGTGLYVEGNYLQNLLVTPGVNEEKLIEISKALNITELLYRNGSLSDGESKKVELLRALSQKKPLYIFDEPETMLDIGSKTEFIRQFQLLEGAVLIATHDEEIISACDRVIRI